MYALRYVGRFEQSSHFTIVNRGGANSEFSVVFLSFDLCPISSSLNYMCVLLSVACCALVFVTLD